jgi:hydroxyethylthiazole kinase-like uncharacterized protein yjeF
MPDDFPSPRPGADPREPAAAAPEHALHILTREAVRSVDRDAVERYRIPGIVLMENASLGLAAHAVEMCETRPAADPHVLIVCGGGNNGGDGWALARHLHNAGIRITVVPLGEPRDGTDAATNCAIVRAMNLPEHELDDACTLPACDLIVDAIFGTGLDRAITDRSADVITAINRAQTPVLAVDVPSGLDCDTGEPLGVCITAQRTVTFVAFKPGFLNPHAQEYLGEVWIEQIGAPVELIDQYATAVPLPDHDDRTPIPSSAPRTHRSRE